MLDLRAIRAEFPILAQSMTGGPLVYLDNAATVQKPLFVLEAMDHYYRTINANVHRGVHTLSQRATDAFEEARKKVQKHIGAAEIHEVIWVRGTTEAVNLVAHGFRSLLVPGDEILVSSIEHHSNLVPWQMLSQGTGATLKTIPMLPNGTLDQDAYERLLNHKTKLVAFNHISNALGTVNPVKKMAAQAKAVGAAVFVDGAQAVPHQSIDVMDLGVDFYAFSGHKMYGPTGIGILYGTTEWLEKLPPYMGGGEMIKKVTLTSSTYAGLPHKFEAGTPDIAGAIGLGAAIDWMQSIGMDRIAHHEKELLVYGQSVLQKIEGLIEYGTAPDKAAVLSFGLKGVHPYDLGTLLDQQGIAVRTGHHCAQPIMCALDIPGTVRASIAVYTTKEEWDALAEGIRRAAHMLQ